MYYFLISMIQDRHKLTEGPFDTWDDANNNKLPYDALEFNEIQVIVKECPRENKYGAPVEPTRVFNFDREEDYPDGEEG
jgi:hypothetical protein